MPRPLENLDHWLESATLSARQVDHDSPKRRALLTFTTQHKRNNETLESEDDHGKGKQARGSAQPRKGTDHGRYGAKDDEKSVGIILHER